MKFTFLILSLFFSLLLTSQNNSENPGSEPPYLYTTTFHQDNSYFIDFFNRSFEEGSDLLFIMEGERINFLNASSFIKPLPPILTTNAADLEICTGNSTRLTASSSSLIRWYTTPPPLGIAVASGTSYITPVLSTGYYTYYAIAEDEGGKSDISAMEVIMVYPDPELKISSSAEILCANETATLTASGTTYFEWENGVVSKELIIKPLQTTNYRLTGINTAGCKNTAVFTQAVEICAISAELTVGIKKATSDQYLYRIYPNPTNGEFHVSVNSVSENTKVELYNAYGQLIYASKVTSEITALDLKDQFNGIYILRIYENDQVLVQEKILKY